MAKDEELSTHMAAGQLQQRPTAREGGLFKRHWFGNFVRVIPPNLNLVRAWDIASTVETKFDPDYSVGVLMGRSPGTKIIYVIDVIRHRFSPAELERRMRSTAILDGIETMIRIPQDPGATGKFFAHYMVGVLQGFRASIEREQGSKNVRAEPFAAQCEHGFVKLVEADWNRAFVEELCAFPNGAHDDQVDAASAAFRAVLTPKRPAAFATL